MLKKLTLLIFVISAFLTGAGITFCFANTLNPNCPDEVKQAIQSWDKGLDERDAKNNVVAPSYGANKKASQGDAATNLRTLFLTSLITLTFNTPVHSQILVSNAIQKLFTIAKHYIKVQSSEFRVQSLVAIFITLKKYFEKIFLILLSRAKALPYILLFLSTFLPFYLSTRLYYRFHNLRL